MIQYGCMYNLQRSALVKRFDQTSSLKEATHPIWALVRLLRVYKVFYSGAGRLRQMHLVLLV